MSKVNGNENILDVDGQGAGMMMINGKTTVMSHLYYLLGPLIGYLSLNHFLVFHCHLGNNTYEASVLLYSYFPCSPLTKWSYALIDYSPVVCTLNSGDVTVVLLLSIILISVTKYSLMIQWLFF